jgi:hypothetical protein
LIFLFSLCNRLNVTFQNPVLHLRRKQLFIFWHVLSVLLHYKTLITLLFKKSVSEESLYHQLKLHLRNILGFHVYIIIIIYINLCNRQIRPRKYRSFTRWLKPQLNSIYFPVYNLEFYPKKNSSNFLHKKNWEKCVLPIREPNNLLHPFLKLVPIYVKLYYVTRLYFVYTSYYNNNDLRK